jgi:hypothetical protein
MCRNAASTSFSEKLALRAMQSRHIGRSMMSAVSNAAVSGMIHDRHYHFGQVFLQGTCTGQAESLDPRCPVDPRAMSCAFSRSFSSSDRPS